MEEKSLKQLNREFNSLCEEYDQLRDCMAQNGKDKCQCFRMNCCNLPEDEVTKKDLIDGIRVLQKALSGNEEE